MTLVAVPIVDVTAAFTDRADVGDKSVPKRGVLRVRNRERLLFGNSEPDFREHPLGPIKLGKIRESSPLFRNTRIRS